MVSHREFDYDDLARIWDASCDTHESVVGVIYSLIIELAE